MEIDRELVELVAKVLAEIHGKCSCPRSQSLTGWLAQRKEAAMSRAEQEVLKERQLFRDLLGEALGSIRRSSASCSCQDRYRFPCLQCRMATALEQEPKKDWG